MRFQPDKFNGFLNALAQQWVWRKAYACPCISSRSGQAVPNCIHCNGNGRLWGDPVNGSACVIGRSAVLKFSKFGEYLNEDIFLEVPSDSPLYEMGVYDRVDSINRTEPFSQNIVAGINVAKKFDVLSVEKVFWLDTDNNRVEGDIPAVQNDGSLSWAGVIPPTGVTYSITGRRNAQFYCYAQLPLDRPHFGGLDLPRRLVLRNYSLYESS